MSKLSFTEAELWAMTPKELRQVIRQSLFTGKPRYCRGYARANLVIVPKEYAFDFLLFCNRNPRPCPVLDVTEPGDPHPRLMAPEADLRTDLPQYRVFKDGKIIDEPTDITNYWRDDLVAFIIGTSGGIDWALTAAGISYRVTGVHRTNIPCIPAGCFDGHMAVTCRLFKGTQDAIRAIQISLRHFTQHGPPVHIGDPAVIGIKDLYHPDLSDSGKEIAPQEPDEVLLFWGCGVTPQVVAMETKVPFMITHYPAHTFITDHLIEELAVL